MHTTIIQTKTHGEIRVHHNSDWSGNAIINCQGSEFELPGEVLLAIKSSEDDAPTPPPPPPVDPAHLKALLNWSRQAGARDIWLIREATEARLRYALTYAQGTHIQGYHGEIELPDGGLLLVIRFPAGDGGPPGEEYRP